MASSESTRALEAERDELKATVDRVRAMADEYAVNAARLKDEARLYPTEQAAPVYAMAAAYQGCADRLAIILGGTDG